MVTLNQTKPDQTAPTNTKNKTKVSFPIPIQYTCRDLPGYCSVRFIPAWYQLYNGYVHEVGCALWGPVFFRREEAVELLLDPGASRARTPTLLESAAASLASPLPRSSVDALIGESHSRSIFFQMKNSASEGRVWPRGTQRLKSTKRWGEKELVSCYSHGAKVASCGTL